MTDVATVWKSSHSQQQPDLTMTTTNKKTAAAGRVQSHLFLSFVCVSLLALEIQLEFHCTATHTPLSSPSRRHDNAARAIVESLRQPVTFSADAARLLIGR